MSIQDTQAQLFGGPSGNSAEIETSGRVIRPLMSVVNAVVDESKFRFDEDGLSVRAVDPANVGMVELDAHAEAFEEYDLGDEEFVAGFGIGRVEKQLRNARMGKSTDDPVSMDIDGTRTLVTTSREYEITTLTQTNEVLNIDPDSVREEPDVPSFELPCEATIDVDAFQDVLESVNRVSDHVVIRERDGNLIIAGRGNEDNTGEFGTVADLGDVVEIRDEELYEGGEESVFSLSYMRDYASALDDGKVDEMTLVFGEEIPCRIKFERTDDETTLYEGEFFQAPRISS